MEKTAAATARSLVVVVEMDFRGEGDSGRTSEEMLAGNVAVEEERGAGGGVDTGESVGKKGDVLREGGE